LQVIAFAQAFPLRWPRFLEDLFAFQGAISTVGEHLLSPDCLSTESAAEPFYSKQIMFAVSPFIVVVMSFVFWFVRGWCSGVSFFAKRKKVNDTTSIVVVIVWLFDCCLTSF
jgi:hypothetical protein